MQYRKTVALLTALVVTAAILACSSVGNLPNPFATATPTASLTPTITPSPTPTSTPTSTPTATPLPTGIHIEKNADGSRVTDYDIGYIIDVPKGWLPIQADAEDLQTALKDVARTNPELQSQIESLSQADPNVFRLVGFYTDMTHQSTDFMVNFNLMAVKQAFLAQLPMDTVSAAMAKEMASQAPGAKIKPLPTFTNPHGVTVGAIEIQLKTKLPNGSSLSLLEKQFYFQTEKHLLALSFAAPANTAQEFVPSFDALVDGIRIMKP